MIGLGLRVAGSLAGRLALASGIGMALVKARPSTVLRVAEDATIGAAEHTYSGVRKLGTAIRHEYRARQIDALQRAVEKQAKHLRDLSPDQRAQLAADEAAIFSRVAELRAKRDGEQPPRKPAAPRKHRRASRAGRSATA
jgi:hypothetical protein